MRHQAVGEAITQIGNKGPKLIGQGEGPAPESGNAHGFGEDGVGAGEGEVGEVEGRKGEWAPPEVADEAAVAIGVVEGRAEVGLTGAS